MRNNNTSGFIHFIPLLLIAAVVLVISFADYKTVFKTDLSNQSVLSESSESGDENQAQEDKKMDESKDSKDVEVKNNDNNRENKSDLSQESKNEENDLEDEVENEKEIDDSQNEDQDMDEAEIESEDGSKLKIKIKSNGDEFEFESKGENVNVKSDFPLSVNSETNELTVTTPAGVKVVAILPDQAVNNILTNQKLTVVTSTNINEGENGELEYQVEGQDEQRLLGLFNVKIRKTFTISATTGQELSNQTDFLNKILDLLSV